MSVASTGESLEGKSWVSCLPSHPIFERQDESLNADQPYLLCETRGDLFVWDPKDYCLRTTNLKRIHAESQDEISEPSKVYQKLHPTITPATQPLSLTPSPNGKHICITGAQYVYVMELRRSRGPYGEFNSGIEETECRTVSMGDAIIRAHRLEVIQVEWSREEDGLLAILTTDEMLRFFSFSEPNLPRLILNTSSKSISNPHCLTLQDEGSIMRFSLSDCMVFLLQDQLDIQTISLREGSLVSPPVPMYPFNEDNYSGNGRGLLLLPTQPPVLVVASSKGTILHCIFMQENEEVDEAIVSVIEIISISETDDCKQINLIPDPVARNNYSIQTSSSIYYVHLPWISNLENYTPDAPSFTATPSCSLVQLLALPGKPDDDSPCVYISDTIMVCDGLLGEAVVAVLSDGSCWSIKSQQYFIPVPITSNITSLEADTDQTLPNEFVCQIQLVFQKASEQQHKLPTKDSINKDSQKDCFDYLNGSIDVLRERYLTPQRKVKSMLENRVNLLASKKARQVNELLKIGDDASELKNENQMLKIKIEGLELHCEKLTQKVETIGCLVSKASPVLSDAEKLLARDLQSMQESLEGLQALLKKARAKLEVGLGRSTSSNRSELGSSSIETVLATVTDNSSTIKESVHLVKELAGVLEVETVK